ncbi:MAG: hypothetical protein IT323_07395 [Anaerolineae bacterium]|nr:hypothetical protein [Anaerolineae bacterium]
MDATSFIDIVGDDRIDAIVNDPRHLSVSAYRAEVILDWIPDTGQYLAKAGCRAQNGLFRTAALAESGIPAILRQRFYKDDVIQRMIGARYVGLVIYDSDHDGYTFTLSEGSEIIGVMRPWRHDNRRHLIVLAEPAQDLKPYVPFVVKAEGKGPCYLESLVFMPERPQPSSFAPSIARLSAQVGDPGPNGVDVTVHFITREASRAAVTATPQDASSAPPIIAHEDGYEALHSIRLRNLQPQARYQIAIEAEERGGSAERAALALDTHTAPDAHDAPLHIPVELCPTGALAPDGLPLTFGVPLREGAVHGTGGWFLRTAGGQIPLQARIHSRWPDGSARWMLLDGHGAAFPAGTAPLAAEVGYAPGGQARRDGLTSRVDEDEITVTGGRLALTASARRAGDILRIEMVQDGGLTPQAFIAGRDLLSGMLKGGLALHAGPVSDLGLEENGPDRAVIRIGCGVIDDRGVEHFRCTLRVHVYDRQPFVRLTHRLIVASPALGPAFASDTAAALPPDLAHAEAIRSAKEGQGASLLCLEHLTLTLRAALSVAPVHVFQPHDQAYQIESGGETVERGARWSGPLYLPGALADSGAAANVAVCVKDFWQRYPGGLMAAADGLKIELFPALPALDWPADDEEWWRLYFWLDRDQGCYRLKTGMAFTWDVLVGLPESESEARGWQDWLNGPVFVRPDVGYLNATRALLPIAPKTGSAYPDYERMMDGAFVEWLKCRDERRQYGFMNFGDTYNEGEGWANNEYDMPFAHTVEFLRGGNPGWALIASQGARHMADIDTCHFSSEPQDVGRQYMHIQGHTGSFLPQMFRSKMAEITSLPSHSWVEGLALHYLLSGDETLRDAALATGETLTRNLRFYDFNNMRECGWHLIHLCGIARLVADPRFLNSAAIIVERVLEQQEPGGGWEHPLSEAHCLCPPPRCRGEAGFMVGVLLSGLRRFYELDPDPRVADAITGGARWLVRRTFVPEAGLFRYTSCPNHHGPKIFYTVMVVEALADASMFTADLDVMNALRRSLAVIGTVSFSGGNAVRYGKDLLIESRYIPTMLAILNEPRADKA